jgi:hypothetical protein
MEDLRILPPLDRVLKQKRAELAGDEDMLNRWALAADERSDDPPVSLRIKSRLTSLRTTASLPVKGFKIPGDHGSAPLIRPIKENVRIATGIMARMAGEISPALNAAIPNAHAQTPRMVSDHAGDTDEQCRHLQGGKIGPSIGHRTVELNPLVHQRDLKSVDESTRLRGPRRNAPGGGRIRQEHQEDNEGDNTFHEAARRARSSSSATRSGLISCSRPCIAALPMGVVFKSGRDT